MCLFASSTIIFDDTCIPLFPKIISFFDQLVKMFCNSSLSHFIKALQNWSTNAVLESYIHYMHPLKLHLKRYSTHISENISKIVTTVKKRPPYSAHAQHTFSVYVYCIISNTMYLNWWISKLTTKLEYCTTFRRIKRRREKKRVLTIEVLLFVRRSMSGIHLSV